MNVGETSMLRRLRGELHVSREALVRASEISVSTVRNAEAGRRICYQSALEIHKALIYWITQKSPERPLLALEDLELNYGAMKP